MAKSNRDFGKRHMKFRAKSHILTAEKGTRHTEKICNENLEVYVKSNVLSRIGTRTWGLRIQPRLLPQ